MGGSSNTNSNTASNQASNSATNFDTQSQQQNASNTAGTYGQNTVSGPTQAALNLINQSYGPISSSAIQGYMSPYLSQVVSATQGQQQQNNAVQQQALKGNAISQNALGGSRSGVAMAELMRGQGLNDASTIANLYSSGYGQALTAAQADRAAALQAAGMMGTQSSTAGASSQATQGLTQAQTQGTQNTASSGTTSGTGNSSSSTNPGIMGPVITGIGLLRDGGAARGYADGGFIIPNGGIPSGFGTLQTIQPQLYQMPQAPTAQPQSQSDLMKLGAQARTGLGNLMNTSTSGASQGSGLISKASNLNTSLGDSLYGSTPVTSEGGWQTGTSPSGGLASGLTSGGKGSGGAVRGFASGGNTAAIMPSVPAASVSAPGLQASMPNISMASVQAPTMASMPTMQPLSLAMPTVSTPTVPQAWAPQSTAGKGSGGAVRGFADGGATPPVIGADGNPIDPLYGRFVGSYPPAEPVAPQAPADNSSLAAFQKFLAAQQNAHTAANPVSNPDLPAFQKFLAAQQDAHTAANPVLPARSLPVATRSDLSPAGLGALGALPYTATIDFRRLLGQDVAPQAPQEGAPSTGMAAPGYVPSDLTLAQSVNNYLARPGEATPYPAETGGRSPNSLFQQADIPQNAAAAQAPAVAAPVTAAPSQAPADGGATPPVLGADGNPIDPLYGRLLPARSLPVATRSDLSPVVGPYPPAEPVAPQAPADNSSLAAFQKFLAAQQDAHTAANPVSNPDLPAFQKFLAAQQDAHTAANPVLPARSLPVATRSDLSPAGLGALGALPYTATAAAQAPAVAAPVTAAPSQAPADGALHGTSGPLYQNIDKRDVAQIAADEFKSAGASDNATRGILANIKDESGFDPTIRHPDQPKWGGEARYAHGLVQAGGAEWNNYAAWLKENAPEGDWRDPQLQVRFTAQNLQKNYPGTWERMNNASAEDAAKIFVSEYEKPAARFEAARREKYGQGVPALEDIINGAKVGLGALANSASDAASGVVRGVGDVVSGTGKAVSTLGEGLKNMVSKGFDNSGSQPQHPIEGGQDQAAGGLLSRVLGINFNPLNLTQKERMTMLSVAAGMMQPGGNIGTGLQAGINYQQTQNQQQRQAVLDAHRLQQESAVHAETARHNKATESYLRNAYAGGMGPDPLNPEHLIPGSWGRDENNQPKFNPGMVTYGQHGMQKQSVYEVKQQAYLGVHPGDTLGALDYASGRKAMSDPEINKAALIAAQRDASDAMISKDKRDEYIQQHMKMWATALRKPAEGGVKKTDGNTTTAVANPASRVQQLRPEASTDIDRARNAIRLGADPEKVHQLLISRGVPAWAAKQVVIDREAETMIGSPQ